MHKTKEKLIERNGLRCMLCGKEMPYEQLNWHHIKTKAYCRRHKEPIDNSYENGSLLCLNCHAFVHTFPYWSSFYKHYMDVVRHNKK